MRILIINYEFPPLGGGGGVFCYQLAKALAKKHQVDYLTSRFHNQPKFEIIEGVRVHRVTVLGRKDFSTSTFLSLITFFPSSLLAGLNLFRKNEYDIINAHFVLPSGLSGVILSKFFKVPIVINLHGGDIYDPSKNFSPHRYFVLRKLIKWILKHSEKVLAQSTSIKEIMSYYYNFRNVDIIPLGIEKPRMNQKITREELGFTDDEIILISVGRLVKRKGFEYAIRAVSRLINNYNIKNIKYIIVGDGPERGFLENLAKKLGAVEKVEFMGFVSEEKKYQLLSISDIYVLSSLHEGFGICLLEAMHFGLPIVATNDGGHTDFLTEGRNALLVPIKDDIALAEKIAELIKNESLRKSISQNNKKDVKKYYIEEIAMYYERLFKEIIESRGNNYWERGVKFES